MDRTWNSHKAEWLFGETRQSTSASFVFDADCIEVNKVFFDAEVKFIEGKPFAFEFSLKLQAELLTIHVTRDAYTSLRRCEGDTQYKIKVLSWPSTRLRLAQLYIRNSNNVTTANYKPSIEAQRSCCEASATCGRKSLPHVRMLLHARHTNVAPRRCGTFPSQIQFTMLWSNDSRQQNNRATR